MRSRRPEATRVQPSSGGPFVNDPWGFLQPSENTRPFCFSFSFLSCADKSNKGGRVCSRWQLKLESILVRKSSHLRIWSHGHMVCTIRKQQWINANCRSVPFLSTAQDASQGVEPPVVFASFHLNKIKTVSWQAGPQVLLLGKSQFCQVDNYQYHGNVPKL